MTRMRGRLAMAVVIAAALVHSGLAETPRPGAAADAAPQAGGGRASTTVAKGPSARGLGELAGRAGLAGVLGAAGAWAVARWIRRRPGNLGRGTMEIIERLRIEPKRSVYLLRAGGRRLLVASTEHGVQLLDHADALRGGGETTDYSRENAAGGNGHGLPDGCKLAAQDAALPDASGDEPDDETTVTAPWRRLGPSRFTRD